MSVMILDDRVEKPLRAAARNSHARSDAVHIGDSKVREADRWAGPNFGRKCGQSGESSIKEETKESGSSQEHLLTSSEAALSEGPDRWFAHDNVSNMAFRPALSRTMLKRRWQSAS